MPHSNKNLVMCPRWVPDTKRDWPTDRRSPNNFNFSCSYITAGVFASAVCDAVVAEIGGTPWSERNESVCSYRAKASEGKRRPAKASEGQRRPTKEGENQGKSVKTIRFRSVDVHYSVL
jgi:hypothetical protein